MQKKSNKNKNKILKLPLIPNNVNDGIEIPSEPPV